jgi:lipoyl(octanoyl) transferase
MSRRCVVYALNGLTHYKTAWKWQKVLAEHVHVQKKAAHAGKANWPDDHLLVLQHPRIFTLGRGATRDNLRFSVDQETGVSTDSNKDYPQVIRVERGGEVTWHGPGQLVAYPILDLNNDRPGTNHDTTTENAEKSSYVDTTNRAIAHKKDLHWYTTQLEETVIRMLHGPPYHMDGVGRHDINTGVWITSKDNDNDVVTHSKISAIGVTASRWITMHGLSLNVFVDFTDYGLIIPCGIQAESELHTEDLFGVCSMNQAMMKNSNSENNLIHNDMTEVRKHYINSFAAVFNVEAHVLEGDCAIEALENIEQQYPEVAAKVLPNAI